MKEKRVLLIFPAAQSRRPVSLDRNFPPIGITKIATALKEREPLLDVQLVDEAYQRIPKIKEGDVVGISCTALNSRRSADIARLAKRSGAQVVVGGPHATNRARQAVEEIPEIDQVVRKHGEAAFCDIIFNSNKEQIVNGKSGDALPFPLPNLKLWKSLVPYEQVFDKSAWSDDYIDGFFLETQRGCSQSPRCSYCVRGPDGLMKIPKERFWDAIQEIRSARLDGTASLRIPARKLTLTQARGGTRQYGERVGKMLVFDFSDEFMAMGFGRIENLHEMSELMPSGITDKVEFLTYARPDQIDSVEVAGLLKKVGVARVSLGIESGNEKMLGRMNRNMTLSDHRRAVRLLADYGIMIYPNFLLGGYQETPESLRETVEHFKELVEIAGGRIYRTGARIVVPFPGSADYSRLRRAMDEHGDVHKAEVLHNSFVMDPMALEHDWLRYCTNILMDDVLDAHSEMMDIARKNKIGMSDRPHLS